tara:strand:+ start:21 stop:1445 length:1425 start_codon:yes stop_codon:yes gene_type:complete
MLLNKDIMKKIFRSKTYWIFVLIIVLYAAVKLSHINYSYSDENTYFYMGKLVSEGVVPYKDFFFSHPPLQIYLFALLFKVFGFNFVALKLIPLVCTIVSGFFAYKIVNDKIGVREAVVALILFLFSYDSMRFSGYAVGVNLTTMFAVIGIYFLLNKKYVLSGVFQGFAGITGLYSLILPFVIFIVLFFKNKKSFLKFFIGFGVVFFVINLIFMVVAGSDYVSSVYGYHLSKPSEESNKFQVLTRLVRVNLLLFGAFFGYVLRKAFFSFKKFNIIFFTVLAYLFFLVLLQIIFGFYSMIIFPLLAVLGGSSLGWLGKKNKAVLVIVVLLMVFSVGWSVNKYVKYDFQDFKNVDEVVEFIESNSEVSDTIYGDDSIATLLALLSGRRITANFADSNNFIFRSEVVDLGETIDTLKKEKVKFIVVYKLKTATHTGRFGPAFIDEFYEFAVDECNVAKEFKEEWRNYEKIVEVYECEF